MREAKRVFLEEHLIHYDGVDKKTDCSIYTINSIKEGVWVGPDKTMEITRRPAPREYSVSRQGIMDEMNRLFPRPALASKLEIAFSKDFGGTIRRVPKAKWPLFEALERELLDNDIDTQLFVDVISINLRSQRNKGWPYVVNVFLSPASLGIFYSSDHRYVGSSRLLPEKEKLAMRSKSDMLNDEMTIGKVYIECAGTYTMKEVLRAFDLGEFSDPWQEANRHNQRPMQEAAEMLDKAYYHTGYDTYDGIIAARGRR